LSYYFHTDPHDPTLSSKGTDPNNAGKYKIVITCPNSLPELDRVYGEITMQPPNSSEGMIADGETDWPLNGLDIPKDNLSAGTYVFRAKAIYEDDDHVEGPNGLTITVP